MKEKDLKRIKQSIQMHLFNEGSVLKPGVLIKSRRVCVDMLTQVGAIINKFCQAIGNGFCENLSRSTVRRGRGKQGSHIQKIAFYVAIQICVGATTQRTHTLRILLAEKLFPQWYNSPLMMQQTRHLTYSQNTLSSQRVMLQRSFSAALDEFIDQ